MSCKTLSKVSFKTPSWDVKIRTVLLATNCKSFNKPLVYKTHTGTNNINSMMKDLISNSSLQKSEKHLANHSPRKILVKKLKQQQIPKSEITSITGHNREAGVDAYDSSDEMQQKQLSHFIDNHQPTASKNKYFISPNNPVIRNTSFSFFPNDDQFYQNISAPIFSALIIVQSIFI